MTGIQIVHIIGYLAILAWIVGALCAFLAFRAEKKAFFVENLEREKSMRERELHTCSQLILNLSQLELKKGHCAILAPMPGMCSPVRVQGNSILVFEYQVFDKEIAEFVVVKAVVSNTSGIKYVSRLFSRDTSSDRPQDHGKQILTKDSYKEPFLRLVHALCIYFPIPQSEIKTGRWRAEYVNVFEGVELSEPVNEEDLSA